jgi:hypothetical protein
MTCFLGRFDVREEHRHPAQRTSSLTNWGRTRTYLRGCGIALSLSNHPPVTNAAQFASINASSRSHTSLSKFALQKVMSALQPIATAKADLRKTPCLLYPRKRTCAVQLAMSAKGQKRT